MSYDTPVTGRVFSYCRCSTTVQDREGADSFSRQEALAADWCRARGVELDSMDLGDVGISAYRGKNLRSGGVLDRFLDMAKAGQLGPSPTLLIEDLDRFSRASPIDVFPKLLQNVVGADITLVVLRKNYSVNRTTLTEDQGTWHRLVADIGAAHDYSKKLSERIISARERERQAIAAGEPLRKTMAPFWVRWDAKADAFVLIEKQASLIRTIFDLTIDKDYGCARIAKWFRERGQLTITGKQFTTSSIHKWANNISVVGLHQPQHMVDEVLLDPRTEQPRLDDQGREVIRRRCRPIGNPVPRYPAVITRERFDLAQQKMKSRTKKGGPRSRFRSPLQGHLYCLATRQPMGYTPALKNGKLYEYLRIGHNGRSTLAELGGTRMISYQDTLAAVLTGLGQTTWEKFFSDADSEAEMRRETSRQTELQIGLDALIAQRQNMLSRVQEVAAGGGDLSLLRTLQDGADLKDVEITERQESLRRTTHRIAEIRQHPMATAWPVLREQIAGLMKAFGSGTDTEQDREVLHDLLAAHQISIFLDTANSTIGFFVGNRSQLHRFNPDWAVVQLHAGLIQNDATPAEVDYIKGLQAKVRAIEVDVEPAPPKGSSEQDFRKWESMMEAAIAKVESDPDFKLGREWVEDHAVLYDGDIAERARNIRQQVAVNRLANR